MLTRVLRTVRLDTIDRRSRVGVALRRVQENLTAQLGGPAEVTAAQALLIEQAAIKAVIVQAVELQQPARRCSTTTPPGAGRSGASPTSTSMPGSARWR